MLKNILATIAGFIVASLVVYIFETLIGHNLFPLPEGSDPTNMDWLKSNMNKIPVGSKTFVVIGHFMGILAGMAVAGFISKTSMIPAYIVGVLLILATAATIFMLPKDLWFIVADAILVIAGFFFGKSLAQRFVFD
ncbi:hypothetical protein [uncultured Lacinutrix sp.]|uniref:hypothetical protein n=1 Tax=uncultured Lacinutrix sp. TaxID=574032 RepID=UPI0026046D25|nr:hypothetical protein [uncultured Lacinutrix sp.]